MGDEDAVYAEVAAKIGKEEISDACARVIASWWYSGQASLGYAFVSTGAIPDNPSDLWQELFLKEYQGDELSPRDRDAANMLGTYLQKAGPRGPVEGWSNLWVR